MVQSHLINKKLHLNLREVTTLRNCCVAVYFPKFEKLHIFSGTVLDKKKLTVNLTARKRKQNEFYVFITVIGQDVPFVTEYHSLKGTQYVNQERHTDTMLRVYEEHVFGKTPASESVEEVLTEVEETVLEEV